MHTETKPRTRGARAGLAALLLVSTAFAVLVATETVSAHQCRGVNPGQTCGDCRSGAHNHRYVNGDLYCESAGAGGGGGGSPCSPTCLAKVM